MSETYEICVMCHNCKHVSKEMIPTQSAGGGPDVVGSDPKRIEIPKGTEVKKFLQGMMCENCGCDGFMGIL